MTFSKSPLRLLAGSVCCWRALTVVILKYPSYIRRNNTCRRFGSDFSSGNHGNIQFEKACKCVYLWANLLSTIPRLIVRTGSAFRRHSLKSIVSLLSASLMWRRARACLHLVCHQRSQTPINWISSSSPCFHFSWWLYRVSFLGHHHGSHDLKRPKHTSRWKLPRLFGGC